MKPNELHHLLKNTKVVRVPISEEKTTIEMDENLVLVPSLQYVDLIRKAALFDALRDDIRISLDDGEAYPIDNDVVMAVTGMNCYKAAITSEKAKLRMKAEEDSKKIETLKEKLEEARAERAVAMTELEALKAAGEKPKEETHE